MNGLRSKLLLRIFLMMIIVSATVGGLMYYLYSSILIDQSINDTQARMDRLSITLQNNFDDLFQFSNYLTSNTTIQNYLKTKVHNTQIKIVSASDMSDYLKNSIFIKQYIHSIALMNNDGTILWTLSPFDDYFGKIIRTELYPNRDLKDIKGFTKEYKLPMKYKSSVLANVFSYFSDIGTLDSGSGSSGKLIVNIDLQSFLSSFESYKEDFENIGIYDSYGELIFYKNNDATIARIDRSGKPFDSGKTEKGYRFVTSVPKCNWTVVSFISQKGLMNKMNSTTVLILIASLFLGIILISLLILPKILDTVKQIVKLNTGMKAVSSGRLDTRIRLSGAREFEELSNGFNHMTTEINRYMSESIQNMEEKQRISFELLFAQFNPHFIYNTLNSVIYLARQEKYHDIIEMVGSFIFLLQDAIHSSGGNIFNSVGDELSTVQRYITIQQYRYINRFDVEVSVEDSLRNTLIPKSVLQPLVENSIIHGICPMKEKGRITLSVTEAQDGRMMIRIDDNGIGMSRDQMERVLQQGDQINVNHSPMLRSIGLGNIIKELKYLYQNKYTFEIESEQNKGTRITITLPKTPNAAT